MAGGWYFFLFVLLISSLALWEFYSFAEARGARAQRVAGTILGILLSSAFIFARLRDLILTNLDRFGVSVPSPSMSQYFLIILLIGVPAVMLRELFRGGGSPLLNIGATLTGALYISVFFGCLIGIRELFVPEDFPMFRNFQLTGVSVPDEVASTVYRWGGMTVLTVFGSIWVCDSAAYFVGRAFGRHKLFERVSPNKTWEGAFAGFTGAVLAFVAGKTLFLPYLSLAEAVLCGVLVGTFGQMGDLVESLLKRDAGVKDSSGLIPGHGGVLDRFDSLLFVSPVLFFYLDFIVF